MNDKKRIWFPWISCSTLRAFEEMLEKEAANGWFPVIGIWNFLFLTFIRGEGGRFSYFIDFQIGYRKGQEGLQGWKLIGNFSNLFFWRCRTGNGEHISSTKKAEASRSFRRTLILMTVWAGAIAIAALTGYFIRASHPVIYWLIALAALIVAVVVGRKAAHIESEYKGDAV